LKILVRYSETERYDPQLDCEVVRLMATTDKGSYHTEVPLKTTSSLRGARTEFKDKVVEYIQAGKNPCEVRLA